jgi:hypothetical protein
MPTQKPAIGVFYKSAGKVVDPSVCIPVKKYQFVVRSWGCLPIPLLSSINLYPSQICLL